MNIFLSVRLNIWFGCWLRNKKINLSGAYLETWDICLMSLSKGCTLKPVLRGHSKIDKTKVLKTDYCLMKVKGIAECSLGAFCNTFDLY